MALFESLFRKKGKADSVSSENKKKEDVSANNESEEEWSDILPQLHAKSFYDRLEFERNKAVEQLMVKYNVAKKPTKGYEV